MRPQSSHRSKVNKAEGSLPQARVGVKYIEMYLSTSTLLIFKYNYKSFFHQSTQVQVLFEVLKYKYF